MKMTRQNQSCEELEDVERRVSHTKEALCKELGMLEDQKESQKIAYTF